MTLMLNILLIEDDDGIAHPLSLYIEKEGFHCIRCDNGTDAVDMFRSSLANLIILDINLPGKSGTTVCEEIRAFSDVPIIVLSARDHEADKLLLFEMGVDDYVAKPFSPRELIARIHAVQKRIESQKKPKNAKILTFGNLTLDTRSYGIENQSGPIRLTKTEFSILEYCIKHTDQIITREAIMKDVMGYDHYLYDRTIDTHMKNIRKKLENEISIETLRGIGYRIHPR